MSTGKEQQQSLMESIVFVILGVAVLSGFVYFSCTFYLQGNRLERMISTQATVLDGRTTVTNRPGQGVGLMYIPEIQVQYEIDGAKFNEWTFPLGDEWFYKKSLSEEALSSYPPKSELAIFVDPTEPRYLLIKRRADLLPYLGSMFLSLMTIGWFSALSVRLRKARYVHLSDGNLASDSASRESGPSYTDHPISMVGICWSFGLLAAWILFAGLNIASYRAYRGEEFEWIFTTVCIVVGLGMLTHLGFNIYVCRTRSRCRHRTMNEPE